MAGEKQALLFPIRIQVLEAGVERLVEYSGAGELRIGRAPESGIPLETKRASRHHASIFFEDGKFFLVDQESKNGTFMNGARISHEELHAGDLIQIDCAQITFGEAAAPAAPALPPTETGSSSAGGAEPVKSRRSRAQLAAALAAPLLLGPLLVWLWFQQESGDSRQPAANPPPATTTAPSNAPLAPSEPEERGRRLKPPGEWENGGAEIPEPALAGSQPVEAPPPAKAPEAAGAAAQVERLKNEALESARQEAEKRWADSAGAAIQKWLEEGRFGEALGAARFAAEIAPTPELAESWKNRAEEIERAAQGRFIEIEKKLSESLAAGKAAEAVRLLLEVKPQYDGARFFGELLPKVIEAGLSGAAAAAQEEAAPPEVARLKDQAALAFNECRFQDQLAAYYALLGLHRPPPERAEHVEGVVRAVYTDRLFKDFLARAAEKPIEKSPFEEYPGRIVAAGPEKLEFELDLDGRRAAYRDSAPWRRLTPLAKFGLFEYAGHNPETLLGLAFFAFQIGFEEGAHRTLIRLRERKENQGLADAVLAWSIGIPVPEGGFVEFKGRLMTPEAKAVVLARIEEERRKEEEARAELKKLRQDSTLSAYVELAKRYRKTGFFKLAQAILQEIARRFGGTPAGGEAARLARDPVLQVHSLVENGPPANRLDFYILGEGYPIEDDFQEAFLGRAQAAMKLLLKDEPYKEYQSYFNFYAVQLGSKDMGVDRIPGNVSKDSALDGKVEWDKFTVDSAKVMGTLERLGEGGADRQAVVIGNDYAGVSTGGGGVSCVTKGSLSSLAHEIGHSLGGLLDEYEEEPGTDPRRKMINKREPNVPVAPLPPNLMQGSKREEVLASALWKYWIDAGPQKWWNGAGVSAFEGGNHTHFNVWRPQVQCMMRSVGSRFCVVCMEVMVRRIYRYARPIDKVEPDRPEIVLRENDEVQVKVWPMKPETHALDIEWNLTALPMEKDKDEETGSTVVMKKPEAVPLKRIYRLTDPSGRAVETVHLRARDLPPGDYRLSATVRDPTPWVLRDEDNRLRQTREWRIRAHPPKKPVPTPGRRAEGEGKTRDSH